MNPARISVLAVAAVVVAFQLPIFDRWFSHMDEGHVLLFSDFVARGGELYRDATLYPLPGAFYGLAQVFKLFGTSILVSRWVVMFEFAAFVAMIYWLMRRMGSPGVAAVAVLGLLVYRVWAFPHWQVYSYSTTSLLLIVGAMLCQLRWFEGRRSGWLLSAGLLFGLSVYCKQDYGAAALIVMTALIVVEGRARELPVLRPCCWFVGGGAAVGALVGLYFFAQGVLPDLLQQTIFNHVRGIGSFEYTSYPSLFPLFQQDPAIRDQSGLFAFFPGIVTTVDLEALRQDPLFRDTIVYDLLLKLFYWGPYAFAGFALARVTLSRSALRGEERVAWLVEAMLAGLTATFVLLLTLNRPQDFLHAAVLVWPMGCLALVYARDAFRTRPRVALVACLVLAVPAVPLLGYTVRGYWLVREQNTELVPGARAGIRARPGDVRVLTDVVGFMRENSERDEAVAVMPYFPIAHFLAERAGPHRSAYIVWPFAEFEDRDEQIVRALDEQQTQLAVYNFTQFSTFPRMDEFAPHLFAYLVDHFETAQVFSHDKSGYRLAGLQRSEVVETPSALLDAAWERTTVWIASEEAPPRAVPPSARVDTVQRSRWPFRHTLALRPASGGRRTVFRVPLRPDASSVLRTAVGLHPEMWFAMPAFETRFEIAVVEPGGAGEMREELFARTLAPRDVLADRGWVEVERSLGAWAGRAVWLELSVAVDRPEGESLMVGGFAEPRVVSAGGPSVPLGGPSAPLGGPSAPLGGPKDPVAD